MLLIKHVNVRATGMKHLLRVFPERLHTTISLLLLLLIIFYLLIETWRRKVELKLEYRTFFILSNVRYLQDHAEGVHTVLIKLKNTR